jgi:hypothetical protein
LSFCFANKAPELAQWLTLHLILSANRHCKRKITAQNARQSAPSRFASNRLHSQNIWAEIFCVASDFYTWRFTTTSVRALALWAAVAPLKQGGSGSSLLLGVARSLQ